MKKYIPFLLPILILFSACGGSGQDELKSSNTLENLSTQKSRYISSHSSSKDPLFKKQWYLYDKYGIDIDLLWSQYLGNGVRVGVVDSGVDIRHNDLSGVLDYDSSYRFSDKSHDPSPTRYEFESDEVDEAHGTAVIGIIAAAHNGLGIMGIAPNVDIVALNVFSKPDDNSFRRAILYDNIDISSNSWGSDLNDGLVDDSVVLDAINKKMSSDPIIYIFASGNDNSNSEFSSVLNSRYTLVVGASTKMGLVAPYSNFGANLLCVAPGGFVDKIVTTDLIGEAGYDNQNEHLRVAENENYDYTDSFEGTSASAAMLSGVVALMKEANPNLSYRDIRYIIAHTAKKIDSLNHSWIKNSAGLYFSNLYGFGLVDAKRAVDMAEEFSSLGEEQTLSREFQESVEIQSDITIEYLELKLDLSGIDLSNAKITLSSSLGTKALLNSGDKKISVSQKEWSFGALNFMDESSKAIWSLEIIDRRSKEKIIPKSAKITIFGH